MENKPKRITSEEIIQTTKKLKKGEIVGCPLCEQGIMQSVIKDYEKSNCFVCSSCGEKLIIN